MKNKTKLIAFSELKIGESFMEGGMVWVKKSRKEARSFGAIGYWSKESIVERVK